MSMYVGPPPPFILPGLSGGPPLGAVATRRPPTVHNIARTNWSPDHETAWRNIRAEFGQVRLAEAMGPTVRWPLRQRAT